MLTSARVPFCWSAALVLALGAATAMAAPPLDPPRQYRVRGSGELTIAGPRCCGDTRFQGQFQAAYQIDSAGQVLLASLQLSLADNEVTVHDGFLGLFSETIRFRCTAFGAQQPALGYQSGNELRFPAGTVRVTGHGAEERLAGGACAPPSLRFDGTNDALVRLVHEPAANRVQLNATFHGTADGESYAFTIRATGTFDNRPPVASMQFETPAAPQGVGCPAVYLPNQGFVAEANHATGLRATLRSSTGDPDGPAGAGSGADLLSQRWLRSRDGGPRVLAGLGYRTDPLTFEWGPTHFIDLLSMDRSGATDAEQCTFRVVDTRPPVVTPPPAKTVACSQSNGASAATSAGVQAFLAGASALDIVDPVLTALAPQMGGVDVTPATVFPGDGIARNVTFRFRDDWGNVGSATSALTVVNGPPTVAVTLTPSAFPADYAWHPIQATVTVQDCGGPVTLKLHKIASNTPAHDATDISGATFGTDDRQFSLFGRPAPFGKPRIYHVTYKGTDASGQFTYATADVKAY
jgi:hypothetical protein